MSITAHEYEKLDLIEKVEILFTIGQRRSIRISKPYQISLYEINEFYVEAWFNTNKGSFEEFTLVKGSVKYYVDSNTQLNTYFVMK